jgi:Ala-tRNA(Pro) deacylase
MTSVEPRDLFAHLDALGIPYRALVHAPTRTSEESARARGEPLEIGAKALLLKSEAGFLLAVLSAALKLDSRAVRTRLQLGSLRFADAVELEQLTGLVPGSVPPFGRPLLPFDLFVDEGIPALDRVAFNAASLTESIVMGARDYVEAARPTAIFRLALA